MGRFDVSVSQAGSWQAPRGASEKDFSHSQAVDEDGAPTHDDDGRLKGVCVMCCVTIQ